MAVIKTFKDLAEDEVAATSRQLDLLNKGLKKIVDSKMKKKCTKQQQKWKNTHN